jgi:hypothetical protein
MNANNLAEVCRPSLNMGDTIELGSGNAVKVVTPEQLLAAEWFRLAQHPSRLRY